MSEQTPGLAIAICDYEPEAEDSVVLRSDVPYDRRVKIAALFSLIGLDRVDRHIREEERSLQDLMRSEVLESKLGDPGHRYPDEFERIIRGQLIEAVSKIIKKLEERDVYLDLSLNDALIWNSVFGNKLTVYPVEVLDPKRLKRTVGGEWSIGGGFFLYRVHRSVPKEIRNTLWKKLEDALALYSQEVV